MPNLLKVAMIETILSLHQRGWSQRRIARELGIDRETVARHLRQPPPAPKPANAPTGSAGAVTSADQPPAAAEQQAAGPPTDFEPGPASLPAQLELAPSGRLA